MAPHYGPIKRHYKPKCWTFVRKIVVQHLRPPLELGLKVSFFFEGGGLTKYFFTNMVLLDVKRSSIIEQRARMLLQSAGESVLCPKLMQLSWGHFKLIRNPKEISH
jgi:hypothetical protein